MYTIVYRKSSYRWYDCDHVHRYPFMVLTDAWLKAKNGKERDKVYEKADRDGLGARVTPKGKVVFQMRYRYNGSANAKRLDLGTYPSMSLKEARAEALRLRGKQEQGHDPKIVRLVERQSIASAASVEALFRLW